MEYNEESKQLIIGERVGDFEGMLQNRTFEVISVNDNHPQAFGKDTKGIIITYDGNSQTIQL